MRLMNEVLRPFLDDFVIVYLDDILIFSKTWEEHVIHVGKIFDVLLQHDLKLNMKKCEVARCDLIYLGFIVGRGELKIDPQKVRVILEWPQPKNVTEVRSFVGACQYVRKFIRNFSMIAAPLHGLTKASAKFVWEAEHVDAFKTLKRKITTAPVLALLTYSGRLSWSVMLRGVP
jgi:hypothetical protein